MSLNYKRLLTISTDPSSGKDELVLKDKYNINKIIEVYICKKKPNSEKDRLNELVKRREEVFKLILSYLEKQSKQEAFKESNRMYSNPEGTLLNMI